MRKLTRIKCLPPPISMFPSLHWCDTPGRKIFLISESSPRHALQNSFLVFPSWEFSVHSHIMFHLGWSFLWIISSGRRQYTSLMEKLCALKWSIVHMAEIHFIVWFIIHTKLRPPTDIPKRKCFNFHLVLSYLLLFSRTFWKNKSYWYPTAVQIGNCER